MGEKLDAFIIAVHVEHCLVGTSARRAKQPCEKT